jgi:hypothetical protein
MEPEPSVKQLIDIDGGDWVKIPIQAKAKAKDPVPAKAKDPVPAKAKDPAPAKAKDPAPATSGGGDAVAEKPSSYYDQLIVELEKSNYENVKLIYCKADDRQVSNQNYEDHCRDTPLYDENKNYGIGRSIMLRYDRVWILGYIATYNRATMYHILVFNHNMIMVVPLMRFPSVMIIVGSYFDGKKPLLDKKTSDRILNTYKLYPKFISEKWNKMAKKHSYYPEDDGKRKYWVYRTSDGRYLNQFEAGFVTKTDEVIKLEDGDKEGDLNLPQHKFMASGLLTAFQCIPPEVGGKKAEAGPGDNVVKLKTDVGRRIKYGYEFLLQAVNDRLRKLEQEEEKQAEEKQASKRKKRKLLPLNKRLPLLRKHLHVLSMLEHPLEYLPREYKAKIKSGVYCTSNQFVIYSMLKAANTEEYNHILKTIADPDLHCICNDCMKEESGGGAIVMKKKSGGGAIVEEGATASLPEVYEKDIDMSQQCRLYKEVANANEERL